MVDAQVIPHLVKLLDSGELPVMTPSLRTLGNIVTGNDVQTDAVIESSAVPVFAKLLQHPKMNIVKVGMEETSLYILFMMTISQI